MVSGKLKKSRSNCAVWPSVFAEPKEIDDSSQKLRSPSDRVIGMTSKAETHRFGKIVTLFRHAETLLGEARLVSVKRRCKQFLAQFTSDDCHAIIHTRNAHEKASIRSMHVYEITQSILGALRAAVQQGRVAFAVSVGTKHRRRVGVFHDPWIQARKIDFSAEQCDTAVAKTGSRVSTRHGTPAIPKLPPETIYDWSILLRGKALGSSNKPLKRMALVAQSGHSPGSGNVLEEAPIPDATMHYRARNEM